MKNSDNIVLIDLNTIDSIPGRRHRHKAIAYINTLCGTIIYPHISQTILEEQVNLIIARNWFVNESVFIKFIAG